jgi:hypothetical protein
MYTLYGPGKISVYYEDTKQVLSTYLLRLFQRKLPELLLINLDAETGLIG